MDENFDTFNINADEAASAIAKSVKADRLVYLTDIAGLYRDINDPTSFINRITIAEAEKMIEDGIVGGGMLPKLSNCTQAVRGGVHRVHILDGRIPHSMLLEFFTDKGIGTMFHLTSDTDMN
jgi:acetylglutamate kinase